jgi:hypothetical protein
MSGRSIAARIALALSCVAVAIACLFWVEVAAIVGVATLVFVVIDTLVYQPAQQPRDARLVVDLTSRRRR